ncbi:hypothetical protein ACFYOT_29410 [Saccharothrix saharensis]|uniref:hypothetical protein n=1 Tax=Saccharothrix saharensis TaxID=571190 RepID=UPI00368EC3D1
MQWLLLFDNADNPADMVDLILEVADNPMRGTRRPGRQFDAVQRGLELGAALGAHERVHLVVHDPAQGAQQPADLHAPEDEHVGDCGTPQASNASGDR